MLKWVLKNFAVYHLNNTGADSYLKSNLPEISDETSCYQFHKAAVANTLNTIIESLATVSTYYHGSMDRIPGYGTKTEGIVCQVSCRV